MESESRLLRALDRSVDAASLGVFRITFGAAMLVEIARYWSHGWIQSHFAVPKHFFSYPGFDWVRPPQGAWLAVHFDLLALAAMCIVLGLFTRIAAAVFAAGFAWWFLSDQTNYLNHFYLIALVSLLLVFVPSDRAFSLEARFRPRPATVPAWAVYLMRFQVGVPYFFGGIAKLNADWLAGEPIRTWLRGTPALGALAGQEGCTWLFAGGGILLDLLVVPALLWKRTRPFAYAAALLFHGTNAIVFSIGIFPWLMIAATAIFFEPDWPRRFLPGRKTPVPGGDPARLRPAGIAAIGAWVAFQVLVPLRHWLYPGNVSWTEEGHLYAWHMKLRDKAGSGKFTARDPESGATWEVDPLDYLEKRQAREMVEHPDMILQFAHIVADEYRAKTGKRLEVRARVLVSLNGRKTALLVDPEVDLAAEERTLGVCRWILPLTEPLRRE